MKLLVIFFLFVAFAGTVNAQTNSVASLAPAADLSKDLNKLFAFKVDSLATDVQRYFRYSTTSTFLYYTVTNRSTDTLTYVTNSCFYYNHYYLKTEEEGYAVNYEGDCYMNQQTAHVLAPGESFSEREELVNAMGGDLDNLQVGEQTIGLYIYLVKDTELVYRVDGRDIEQEKHELIFNGRTKIIRKVTEHRKLGRNKTTYAN